MQETNLDIYGDAPIPWSRALDQLRNASDRQSYWLAMVRPGGQPHVAAVGALWLDDKLYFTSGPRTRKSQNLAANPSCVISVSLPDLDLVVEGTATRVTDEATLKRLVERFAAQGWPASVGARRPPSPRRTARRAPGRRPGTSTWWHP
jgi:hypothetical protein